MTNLEDKSPLPRVVYVDANAVSVEAMRGAGQVSRISRFADFDVHLGAPSSPAEFLAVVGDAKAVIVGGALPDVVLEHAHQLELVSFIGQGASNYVNLPLAARRGIAVAVTPGYGNQAVAEHVLALLFGVARRVVEGDRHVREHRWRPFDPGNQLSGKTVGIIGYGGIGSHTASLLNAVGMRVLAWTRTPPSVLTPGIRFTPINELLEAADVISLHLELNEQTRGFISGTMLDRLKPGAIVINTARAELIEPGALETRLSAGVLSAGLDVYMTEPPRTDDPLLDLDNVVLSPHQGYHTPEAFSQMLRMVVDNVHNYFVGGSFHQARG